MTEYNLEELTIHTLRDLARQLEINAPTSKKREELIRLIKLARYGNLPDKYRNKYNKGRPVKENVVIKVTSDISPLLEIMYHDIIEIEKRLATLKEKLKRYIE